MKRVIDTPEIPDMEERNQRPEGSRHEKGTGMDVIAAERLQRDEKTSRLKAAREVQEGVQAKIDAEAERNATPKKPARKRAA